MTIHNPEQYIEAYLDVSLFGSEPERAVSEVLLGSLTEKAVWCGHSRDSQLNDRDILSWTYDGLAIMQIAVRHRRGVVVAQTVTLGAVSEGDEILDHRTFRYDPHRSLWTPREQTGDPLMVDNELRTALRDVGCLYFSEFPEIINVPETFWAFVERTWEMLQHRDEFTFELLNPYEVLMV